MKRVAKRRAVSPPSSPVHAPKTDGLVDLVDHQTLPVQPIRNVPPDPSPSTLSLKDAQKLRLDGATQADIEVRWEILRAAMESSVSSGDPDRFTINAMVEESTNGNGDRNTTIESAEIRRAIDHFRTLPDDRARRLLGGWSPDALSVNRTASLDAIRQWALYPVLTLRVGYHSAHNSYAQFDDYPDDDFHPVRLLIGVGVDKRKALESLDHLRLKLDSQWDDLIAGKDGGT